MRGSDGNAIRDASDQQWVPSAAAVEPSPHACEMSRRACALTLNASRQRDTGALLRFLTWSTTHHHAEAARLEREACAAHPARRAAVAAWWTVARWLTASPHPVLLLMLADFPGSLSRHIDVMQWWAPYCLTLPPHTARPEMGLL
ncbi:hypothetical protein ACFYWY_37910 [Streptomyces sp. NPDC002870]|uniref:hypothetical protein n=1 Tax=Streptomyces sp. NPDC002870 TaxID=3364666 RepID=UPI0036B864AE